MTRILRLALGVALAVSACAAASLAVDNPAGSIEVVVTNASSLKVDGRSPVDFVAARDLDILRNGADVRLIVRPRNSPLDLIVYLPLGFSLEANTMDGDITVEGMVHLVRLQTDTGAIRLKIPLRGTQLTFDAEVPPLNFVNPDRGLFRISTVDLSGGRTLWRLCDRLEESDISYGAYHVKARAPRSVEILAFQSPSDWPLRFHWEASKELEKIFDQPVAFSNAGSPSIEASYSEIQGDLLFRSDVRMVNLAVAVSDRAGHPATNLAAHKFHVLEDGVEQRIEVVHAGDAAFNLVILLDMSGSAALDLEHMRTASRRFIDMARSGDRVAIYALSQSMFQVVSPLTSDRNALLAAIQNLPPISGASPLYDVVLLSYAQELRQRQGERNALIVISDGLDNQITNQEAPSSVKFRQLQRVAEEMNVIIYPVFLLSGQRFGRGFSDRANQRMSDLAKASGGRLFPADSIADLDPVFPLIEAELRSVYSLEYYPANQNFDGSWRTVNVYVDEPEITVRARPGYYAN